MQVRSGRPWRNKAIHNGPCLFNTEVMSILKGLIGAIPYRWNRLQQWVTGIIRGLEIVLATSPKHGIRVSYGHDRLPRADEKAYGGVIKLQRLNNIFPHTPRRFNILYMVSSSHPPYAKQLLYFAKRKGIKLVWNQNGVGYPAWHPSGWKELNESMSYFHLNADYVFYQSKFAQHSAQAFLGRRDKRYEILYNAVDTRLFCPQKYPRRSGRLELLMVGTQYHIHPLVSAIRSLACILEYHPLTHLLIVGNIKKSALNTTQDLINELGVKANVSFLSDFAQRDAPDLYRQHDILLHTKIQDVCPGVVIEAMACGLPVVYSLSGGVPEIVGRDAGMGVATEANWEKRIPPEPRLWAEAILKVADNMDDYKIAARTRAVERFDIGPWIDTHRRIFEEILG